MPLKLIFNKNVCFDKQKCMFDDYLKVRTRNNFLKDIIFVQKIVIFTLIELPPEGLFSK